MKQKIKMLMLATLVIWITAGGLTPAVSSVLKPIDAKQYPHLYQWTDTCHGYVLKHGDANLLIDLGDGSVLNHLREIGVRRIEWVLFTHHHREQCQGHRLLPEATRIAASATEQALLETLSAFRKWNEAWNKPKEANEWRAKLPQIEAVKE